ncbi:MAG: hypothetical protein K0R39_3129 [Symbiobacteriaceae bacterium]|jgi:hypothetical protein|nr:hypothetical protein [Symbiobacteriaceae bacterium]
MDQQAMAVARELAERYMGGLRGDLIDGVMLVKVAMAGYLAASGVPTDEAVAAVEKATVGNLVGPVPANPMYHGLPWLVPGPASGAPYYKE